MELVSKNNPILYKECRRVNVKQGRETGRRLLKFMERLNRANLSKRAVGIAAPQVGIDASVCALSFLAYESYILINPKIIKFSSIVLVDKETCLSFPGEEYNVERHTWCLVEADGLDEPKWFGPKEGEYWSSDLLLQSRCVQHEIDHLLGITINKKGSRTCP